MGKRMNLAGGYGSKVKYDIKNFNRKKYLLSGIYSQFTNGFEKYLTETGGRFPCFN
ncbi:MAG: hypothetical protein GX348_08240 [Veillonellaceae bacterium]|nr:hypothetical protein [Veillonellaceae bacterium]